MRRIVRIFLAGLLGLLPLVVTISATIWLGNLAIGYLGPGSTFGSLLTSIGLTIDDKALAPYLGGLTVSIAVIFVFGLLVESSIGRWYHSFIERMLRDIPIIGSFYQLSKRVVSVVDDQEAGGIKNMTPIWCFFGGDGGAAVLALLPSPTPIALGSTSYVGILVPSAPVPVGGALVYVPEDWIKPAEVGIDELVSIYVSMGMTPPPSSAGVAGAPSSGEPLAAPMTPES